MRYKPEQNKQEKPDIQSELIRIVYSAIPQSLVAILINSIILAVIQWNYIEHATIIIWFVITNSLSIIRFVVYKKFNALPDKLPLSGFWGGFIFFSSIASGLTWGAVALWMFPPDNIAHQVILAFVIAGMCAGAVTTLSPMLSSLFAFVILSVAPIVVQFLFLDVDVAYTMAVMSFIFVLIILKTAMNFNKTVKESLLIRYEQRLSKKIIEHQTLYDPLTNLPNRRLLIEKIKDEIAHAIRHDNVGAVLFLDLDYFKTINDSMGHAVGDKLLRQIADRLTNALRQEDTIARLGGDEFVILISSIDEAAEAANKKIKFFAEKIMSLFENEFDVNGQAIFISASIGISTFPEAEAVAEELLQKSDVAMYEAKSAGRNKMRFFIPEMQQHIIYQRELEKGLRNAIINDELELYYQPLFDADNKMFSVEALIRWNHPEMGLVPPIDFIGLAEKRGLIIPIGDWVLEQACSHLVLINENADISMSINVSTRQFNETTFVEKMLEVLARTGVNPKQVTLEITESMIMVNVDDTIDKMKELTAEGICFSIDDFGTGYSSLAYLKKLPVELLKIDKSFVLDIPEDSNDAVIVETILAMACHMKIDVIAEGVETQEALEFLKSKGCCKFQGYLFARPMPFDELNSLIENTQSVAISDRTRSPQLLSGIPAYK